MLITIFVLKVTKNQNIDLSCKICIIRSMKIGDLKMRNKYLENLCKIEFVVTNACTGRCIHCSAGTPCDDGQNIDARLASQAVEKIASLYDIKTVMTFGGEPLLYPDTVFEIMNTAKKLGILKRQVITNGFFSENPDKIRKVAQKLCECGVNDLLLSVDAFHQRTIPLDVVKMFAKELISVGVPVKLQPAWLVKSEHKNPYNEETHRILDSFSNLDIGCNDGNIVFPEGNAKKYLAEYFAQNVPDNPYVENKEDVRCVSFSANGDVFSSNFYKQDILEILYEYKP